MARVSLKETREIAVSVSDLPPDRAADDLLKHRLANEPCDNAWLDTVADVAWLYYWLIRHGDSWGFYGALPNPSWLSFSDEVQQDVAWVRRGYSASLHDHSKIAMHAFKDGIDRLPASLSNRVNSYTRRAIAYWAFRRIYSIRDNILLFSTQYQHNHLTSSVYSALSVSCVTSVAFAELLVRASKITGAEATKEIISDLAYVTLPTYLSEFSTNAPKFLVTMSNWLKNSFNGMSRLIRTSNKYPSIKESVSHLVQCMFDEEDSVLEYEEAVNTFATWLCLNGGIE